MPALFVEYTSNNELLSYLPREKKSVAGGGGGWYVGLGAGLMSSTLILLLPLPSDGGRILDELALGGGKDSAGASSYMSASSSCADGRAAASGNVLNTRPGRPPPPKTRSAGGGIGFFTFGAGSIDNKEDMPAPDSSRGFLAAGRGSSSSSPPCLLPLSSGRPIAIFLTFFAL